MAPAAGPLDELMREQYDFLYSLMFEISEEQQEEKDKLFAELDKLKNLNELPEDVQDRELLKYENCVIGLRKQVLLCKAESL